MLSYLLVKRMEAGLAVILVSLLSYHITLGQSDDLNLDGSINIDNPTVIYRRGDNLTFIFSVSFNVTNDLDTLNISIWSQTLKFSELSVQWTLDGLDVEPTIGSKPKLTTASPEVLDESLDGQYVYCLHLSNIKANRWLYAGQFSMTVKDDAGPGRRIQSYMNVSIPILEGNATTTSVIPSQYGHIPSLKADLNPPPSTIIGIMQTATVNVSLTLTDDNAAPLVEIISTFENTSREVMLTVNKVKVNKTFGFESGVVEDISQVVPEMKSTLMTYQNDIGSVQLPRLINDVGKTESGVDVEFQLRLEDYTVMENGDELIVGSGVKFGDGMIWVSDITLTVDAPDAANRRPDLKLVTSVSSVCTEQDRNDVKLVLNIKHSKNSTATAYDLQLNVFPLPSMTLLSSTNLSPQDYPFIFNTTEYIRITLGRLTFSDPGNVKLKMRVQMNDSYIHDATDFIVPVELIYNDRWNGSADRVIPMQYMDIKLNKKCAERYTWTTDSTCPCGFDAGRFDCGCCVSYEAFNVTQCGEDNPGVCGPTHKPWLCWKNKNDFLSHSKLSGFSGELYTCDASQKYRWQRNSEISCYKTSSDGYLEVHPMVAVVLGKDSATGTLYGVSSTGHAYVISKDAGESWCTIRESDLLKATSTASYTAADIY